MAGPRRWMIRTLILLLLSAGMSAAGDAPEPSAPSDPPPRMPRADSEPLPPASAGKLPADAKAVVLPRDEYQGILDELARLRDQLKPPKPQVPSFCELSGQIDGDLIRLHVQFKFRTERINERVTLGCASANPTEAKLDGQLPNITKTVDHGFVVQAPKAGEHRLQLDLECTATGKENERSFMLELPGAAVTTVEFDLPEGVKAARIGPDIFKAEPQENKRNRVKAPVGPLQRLDVAWTLPIAGTPQTPFLAVDTRIAVHVDETQVVTDAELTLKAMRGEPSEWLLQVPPQAELRKQGVDERIQSVVEMDPQRSIRVLKLTAPSSKDVKVAFRVRQPRDKKAISVGPFAVPAAARQQGTLTVSAPADVSITYRPRGDLSPRPVTDEERRRDPELAAAYRYWNLPGLEKPLLNLDQPAKPLLDLEIETVKGDVEARVRHDLRLVKPEGTARPIWRLTTTIEGTAYRTRAQHLQVQLPPDFHFDENAGVQPIEFVQSPEINPATHVAQFTLLHKKPDHFQVIFQGTYTPFSEDERSLELPLPKCIGVLDRGAVVAIAVPDDWRLLPPKLPGSREPVVLEPRKQTWHYDQTPANVRVEFQSERPDSGPPGASPATRGVLRVERALIQATVGSSGYQSYWGWFLIKPERSKSVDVELPAPATVLHLKVFVDGKPAEVLAVDEAGKAQDVGKIARVSLTSASESSQVILKMEYQLPPGDAGGSGLVHTRLQPPVLRGDAGWTPLRWQVSFPSSWLPVDVDSSFRIEQGWMMRGWLLGPRPAPSPADSEGWSLGMAATGMPPGPEGEAAGALALVGWQSSPGPLRVTHAGQQSWLLACSLAALALGLAAGFFKWPRGIGWVAALGVALAIAALGLFKPHFLAVLVYGGEPGLLVLVLVVGMQWFLHERYRRQVVFLPGFQRTKSGSSLQRAESIHHPRAEPTTVDAPAPVDGGAQPVGSGIKKIDSGPAKTTGDSRNL